jgi:hypothetical protein
MFLRQDIDKMNDDIADWNRDNLSDIRNQISSLGIKHYAYSRNPTPLANAIRGKLFKRADLVNKIGYSMPRSAVFLAKGVSRGHTKNNPRTAKDWFNEPVEKNLDSLGDIVADNGGNLIVNALKIK